MKIILISILLFISFSSSSQKLLYTNLDDSTFLVQDTATEAKIPDGSIYSINVTIMGLIRKQYVQLIHNNKVVFADTVTTVASNEDSYLPSPQAVLKVNNKEANTIKFIYNQKIFEVPFKCGYSLLYISVAPNRIQNKNVLAFYFEYTNTEIVDL
jgi:hypothetical protein